MFFNDFISRLPKNINSSVGSSYWIFNPQLYKKYKPSIFFLTRLDAPAQSLNMRSNLIYNRFSNYYVIYFLRKEVFYTKLKYSRVPQFDTSSGASASFISGFYGFLVCEKFGFELIDSGDFFFLIFYIVLYSLIFITLTQIFNHTSSLLVSILTLVRSFRF